VKKKIQPVGGGGRELSPGFNQLKKRSKAMGLRAHQRGSKKIKFGEAAKVGGQ